MKILVVNCNTSRQTTSAIRETAQAVARRGTKVDATQPTWGVESAEGYLDSFVSAAAVLDVLSTIEEGYDAVVLAGYGEHGREGARQLLDIPVVDITEASAQVACLIGHRYGVVTSLNHAVAGIWDNLRTAGLDSRCVGVSASEIPVLKLHHDPDETAAALAAKAGGLIDAGADVIVLGCAGMAGQREAVERLLPVPVVEGVSAAVALAESLVTLGLATSKAGPYAPVSATKSRPGWPVSRYTQPDRDGHPAPI